MLLVGNKKDLIDDRKVTYDEGADLAAKLKLAYFETSAKTRENVDSVFSQILIKIKEMKEKQSRSVPITTNSYLSPQPQRLNEQSQRLTKKEEEELREYSKKKRIQKFYQNLKKKCIIS